MKLRLGGIDFNPLASNLLNTKNKDKNKIKNKDKNKSKSGFKLILIKKYYSLIPMDYFGRFRPY
jgi:hypothetical protein